jgi:hypothetical protein
MACTAWVQTGETWGFQTLAAGDEKCGTAVCDSDKAGLVSSVAALRTLRDCQNVRRMGH